MIQIRKLISLTIVIILLSSCSVNNYKDTKITYTLGDTSVIQVSDYQLSGDLIVSLDKEKYTKQDSIVFSIINNTNDTLYIQTNDVFFLEKKVNNEWKKVLFNIIPPEKGQEIESLAKNKPFDTSTRTLDDWLTEGTFRIVIIVSKSSDITTNDFTLISDEFTVY